MPEIDMRKNPWNPGIPLDGAILARDIYRLLCIFSASRELSARRADNDDEASVYGYGIRNFELPEVARLLVSLAAGCRNDWDHRSASIDDTLQLCGEKDDVGILIKDTHEPSKKGALRIRESWNKILHCHTMNFERSDGSHLYSGQLEPHVHLYGHYQDAEWKASIDVFRWCEVMQALA